jgi:hypothetical protein
MHKKRFKSPVLVHTVPLAALGAMECLLSSKFDNFFVHCHQVPAKASVEPLVVEIVPKAKGLYRIGQIRQIGRLVRIRLLVSRQERYVLFE